MRQVIGAPWLAMNHAVVRVLAPRSGAAHRNVPGRHWCVQTSFHLRYGWRQLTYLIPSPWRHRVKEYPPRYRAVAAVLLAGMIACAAEATDPVQRYSGNPAHDCIAGCQDPPVVMTMAGALGLGASMHGDTAYLPDSTNNSAYTGHFPFSISLSDTTSNAVAVGSSVGQDCANSCVFPAQDITPTPDVVSIDAHSTEYTVYWYFQTGPAGSGTVTLYSGSAQLVIPVVVYHCTSRLSC